MNDNPQSSVDPAFYFDIFFSGKQTRLLMMSIELVQLELERYIRDTNWDTGITISIESIVELLQSKGYAVAKIQGETCCNVEYAELHRLCDINNIFCEERLISLYQCDNDFARAICSEKKLMVESEMCDNLCIDQYGLKRYFEYNNNTFTIGFEKSNQVDRQTLVVRQF